MTTEHNNFIAEETEVAQAQPVSETNTAEETREIVEEIDYKSWSKEDLIKGFHEASKSGLIQQAIKTATKIKSAIEEKVQEEKLDALNKFIEDGGVEDDFEFKGQQVLFEIEKEFKTLKNKQKEFYNDLNRKKQVNYQTRLDLLNTLRALVDGQKTITFKQIQEEWKKASPVPQEFNEELWANYNALSNRYYDNRNIDFELKELDRKKNLELKLEICQKAEALSAEHSINKSLDSLNHLHREYKHVGPVPEEQKEIVWQRFKAASDALYAKRDDFLQQKQAEHSENLAKKKDFLLKLELIAQFTSDVTEDWKKKLAEFEILQKEWASLGFSGKEDEAKEIGKKYWELTKTFFRNKNEHYKKVFDVLQENVVKKEGFISIAENLATEEDLEKAIKTVIDLQRKWKEAGHVPFKLRDKIYDRFKKACDKVFDRKRSEEKEKESEYEENLLSKQAICKQLATLDANSKESYSIFKQLLSEWKSIGFVPKKDLSALQTSYSQAVKTFLDSSTQNEDEKRKIKLSLEIEDLKSKPDARLLIQKKEGQIKGRIKGLETEAETLKNNLLFFARSKNASALAKDVEDKVLVIEKQIKQLLDELNLIKAI
jgi:hypothetical protein